MGGGYPMPGSNLGKPESGVKETPVDETDFDHSRSVVVVIPLEGDLISLRLNSRRAFNKEDNPAYRKFSFRYYGQREQSALFVDSTSIQLYTQLLDKPAPKKTRHTEMRLKYYLWEQSKKNGDKANPDLLYEALILALQSGFMRDLTSATTAPPRWTR